MDFLNKIDSHSKAFLKVNRQNLTIVSRLFLVATFIEDGVRMFQFNSWVKTNLILELNVLGTGCKK